MSFPGFGAGGGGMSASSSAATGPQRSGDISGPATFGGINTGTQSILPPWVIPVALGIAAIVAIVYFRRK